jgi:hypothetical protein
VVRKYGDSKFPRYDPGGQNMTERLTYLAQTLMVLYDRDGKNVKEILSPVFSLYLAFPHQWGKN